MERNIVLTDDSSPTVYVKELNTHYHSTHGAIQESLHVFIRAGLEHWLQHNTTKTVHIFEMGFGTGLNTLLTLHESLQHHFSVNYYVIELFPLGKEEYEKLNYSDYLSSDLQKYFLQLHESEWEKDIVINENFTFHKSKVSLVEMQMQQGFDIVYFDAFDPTIQPELWKKHVFEKIFASMNCNGIFVTYSSKGEVRRTLTNCGFTVKKIKGPKGKREIIRATKLLKEDIMY